MDGAKRRDHRAEREGPFQKEEKTRGGASCERDRMLAVLHFVLTLGLAGALRPPQLSGSAVVAPHLASPRIATRSCVSMLAKKKKGGGGKQKKGGGKKQSGFAWAQNFELKPTESAALRELAEVTASAYRARTGKVLHRSLDTASDLPKALWSAPVCIMVVNEGESGGATVAYANPAAAEAYGHEAKDGYKQLMDGPTTLAASLADGKYESGYSKKLTVSAGDSETATIMLRDAERWVLEKMAVVDGKLDSERLGLAYAWHSWELEDGTTCKPGGERIAPEIDPAEVQAALDAQAALIRKMKEEDGLTNQDDEVQDAVAELKRLKALLPPED